MSEELDDVLDEEGDDARTTEAQRAEAEAWDRLVEGLRRDVPGPAPPWLEERIMAEVRDLETSRGRRSWLFRPRTLRASPAALGLAAAVVLVVTAGPWLLTGTGRGSGGARAGPPVDAVVYVRFELEAPGARSVAVSGDFNEWDPTVHHLEDVDGNGVWTARVPVRPGIHEYMFVVDGDRWITDPRADRYTDDGFGNRNAVLALAGPGRT